jgi:hypothetical protein
VAHDVLPKRLDFLELFPQSCERFLRRGAALVGAEGPSSRRGRAVPRSWSCGFPPAALATLGLGLARGTFSAFSIGAI